MKRLKFYIRLWCGYMRIGVLVLVQYPADTVIWIASMLLREAAGFLGIVTIANVAGGLGNWNLYEICLLFSMCAIIEAIGQAFLDNVWGIGGQVRRGRMDVILVRPASPFVQMLGQRFHFQAVLSMLVYGAVMVWAMSNLHIRAGVGTILFLVEFVICATIINTGIYTIFNSFDFWIVQGEDIASFIQTCREFAKYPVVVFPAMVRSFFTYIIPFGFVGYYPAAYLAGKAGMEVVFLLPVCAGAVALAASLLWRLGIGSYNSTGT